MAKNKHLSLSDRLYIQRSLDEGLSFKEMARELDRDPSTISKEIRNHIQFNRTGAYGRPFNDCHGRNICRAGRKCPLSKCPDYMQEICSKLSKAPYVCANCPDRRKCTLEKRFYDGAGAHAEYKDNLSEARKGFMIEGFEDGVEHLNNILLPLIRDQGQSIHHAYVNNKDIIMYSERSIYRYIDEGIITVRNYDLPRKVRYRARKGKSKSYKVDKKCLENRRYEDFEAFMASNPDTAIVEMDSVINRKGGKALLTIHFVSSQMMFAFIRDHNDSRSVTDIFNSFQSVLGIDKFKELFPVILTDNGSEFSDPTAIEFDPETGELRARIFYCHPSSPFEKGACEVNHELLRRIIPKERSIDNFDQTDVDLMMSHINSYGRKKLNDKTPYELFATLYGKEVLDKLNIKRIDANDVVLKPSLIKK